MAYTPTEWQSGDVVTSAKLNKIENGIANASAGGGIMYVTITSEEVDGDTVYSADKTLAEIIAALEAGQDVKAILASDREELCCYLKYWSSFSGEMETAFWQTTVAPTETPTTAYIQSTNIEIYNDGGENDEDVIEVNQVEGSFTITIS